LEVAANGIDMIGERFGGEYGDERSHCDWQLCICSPPNLSPIMSIPFAATSKRNAVKANQSTSRSAHATRSACYLTRTRCARLTVGRTAPQARTPQPLAQDVNTVRRNFQEKRRKGEPVNLKECPLLEMTQFSCNDVVSTVNPPAQLQDQLAI
jgi:hypothetical protein